MHYQVRRVISGASVQPGEIIVDPPWPNLKQLLEQKYLVAVDPPADEKIADRKQQRKERKP